VLDEFDRLRPNVISLLGGPRAVSDDVLESLPSCD
jgi:hypothetical protein